MSSDLRRSSSSSEEHSLNHHDDNISVVLRVRPLNSTEINRRDTNAIAFAANESITIDQTGSLRTFTFDTVFGPEADQKVVFEKSRMPHLIEMAIEGYTSMAMTFGQTGSGKTHSMTGPPTDLTNQFDPGCNSKGIVQRSFEYLFEKLTERTKNKATVKASYLEIYNEQVIDLLNPQPWRNLMIRWSKRKGFYVENLFQVQCEDVEDLISVLEDGKKKRHIGCQSVNEWSSRSHSILTLTISEEVLQGTNPDIYLTKKGKLVFADLAGSEKFRDSCVTEETMIESNNINKSLLVLGKCISALGDPKKRHGHIPYRDSKLTKLLAEGLRGNSVTLLLACVTPSSYNASESLNTLRYASRAKQIHTNPVVIYDPREKIIFSMKKELEILRNENQYLRRKLDFPSKSDSLVHNVSKLKIVENSNPLENETASLNTEERSLYEMLQEYMIENETLRAENRDLQEGRQQMARELKQVYKENEKLQIQAAKQRMPNEVSSSWRTQAGNAANSNPWQSYSNQPWLDITIPSQVQLQPVAFPPDHSIRKRNPRPINLPMPQRSLEMSTKNSPRFQPGRNVPPRPRMTGPVNPTESVEMFNQRLREELAVIDGAIKSEELNQSFYKSTIPSA